MEAVSWPFLDSASTSRQLAAHDLEKQPLLKPSRPSRHRRCGARNTVGYLERTVQLLMILFAVTVLSGLIVSLSLGLTRLLLHRGGGAARRGPGRRPGGAPAGGAK